MSVVQVGLEGFVFLVSSISFLHAFYLNSEGRDLVETSCLGLSAEAHFKPCFSVTLGVVTSGISI